VIDYKEKIKKLLALSESPNENEAKAALLKARQFMAEHKILEYELNDTRKQEVRKVITDITFTTRKNPWMLNLSLIIGENYCCKSYVNKKYHGKNMCVGFVGFEEDLEICIAVFKYAVDCILSQIKVLKKENMDFSNSYVKNICDSYGRGFTDGIKNGFEKQQGENEAGWGLVLMVPKEVEEVIATFRTKKLNIEFSKNEKAYSEGYVDGKKFDSTRRVASA